MASLSDQSTINIRVFGSLRRYMDAKGLSYSLERTVPMEGLRADLAALDLGIPVEEIEAVFRNGRVINIYDLVFPGDRVSFFPHGTPGPYRVFLGFARENLERARREIEAKGRKER
jgi:hypothetical protein